MEVKSFVYGNYIDEPVCMITESDTYCYHSNHLFSVGALTDSSGTVTERYTYNAYGEVDVVVDDKKLGNPYLFTGRRRDEETGLYYFRARMYCPACCNPPSIRKNRWEIFEMNYNTYIFSFGIPGPFGSHPSSFIDALGDLVAASMDFSVLDPFDATVIEQTSKITPASSAVGTIIGKNPTCEL